MRSIFRKKILSAILFAFAVIAFMEIWARIDDFIRYDAPLLANYSQESMLVLEDSIGIRGKPNGRFEKWRLNNLGFRGANITQEKLPQVLRIVTLGASETFGIYESQDMEWPRQLEASLAKNFPDKKIEVVNVSFPGLGMESIRHYYETHVRPIDPDFVLLYSNFLAYLEKPKPAFTVSSFSTRKAPK